MYFIMLLIPLLWYLLSARKSKTTTGTAAFLFTSVLLLLISSLRNEQIGDDYHRYVVYFDLIGRTEDAYFKEKGYVFYNYLLSLISSNYVTLAAGVNLLLFIPLFSHIKRNVEPKYWALCMLIFVANPYMYVQTTFNLLRQCCATGFILIACQFFKKKQFFPSIIGFLFILIATQFHRSAILVVIFVLPCLLSIKWSATIWRFIFIFFLGINLSGGVEFVFQTIVSELFYEKYATYEASLLQHPAYLFLCFMFFWWVTKIYDKLDPAMKEDFFVNMFLICMCILPVALKNDMIYRMRIYLQYMSLPGMVTILTFSGKENVSDADLAEEIGDRRFNFDDLVKQAYVMYYICFFIAYFIYLYLKNDVSYVPFKFI